MVGFKKFVKKNLVQYRKIVKIKCLNKFSKEFPKMWLNLVPKMIKLCNFIEDLEF